MTSLKNYIVTLNLFRPPEGADPESEHQRRSNIISTRVYLVLLFVILLGLIFATSLSSETISIIILNPTQTQYESLTNPVCPCSHSSIFYNQFVSNEPTFHPICSSQFVSEEWISAFYFGVNSTYFLPIDLRATALGQWQALASFCQLAQTYVYQNLLQFGSTSFISSYVISKSILQTQVNTYVNQFQQSIPDTLERQIQLVGKMFLGDQLMNGLETSFFLTLYPGDIGYRMAISVNIFQQEDESWCYCIGSVLCYGASGFYDEFAIETGGYLWNNFSALMKMPGFTTGCNPVASLLQSTLECFFNQTCVDAVTSYSQMPEKNFTALTEQPSSRFDINATTESIVNQLMVEDWGNNISFNKYYAACAPFSCSYSLSKRHDFLYVLNTLIGLLGGLCAGFSIIVPLVINFIRRQSNNQVKPRITWMERLRQLKTTVKRILTELNLFEMHPSDQRQVHHQRTATRLYIIVLLSTLVVLVLYSALTEEVDRETIENPTQSQFSYLQSLYPTSLDCPCSSISNAYEVFLNISPEYHQICSSDLVSSAWTDYLYEAFLVDVYYYYMDFRIAAVFQFDLLITYYEQARETITNSLQLFLQQHYVTSQVVSEQLFDSEANNFIEDWKAAIVKDYLRTIKLIQANRQGNQYYAAGYSGKINIDSSGKLTHVPWSYIDDETQSTCDCALDVSCHSQMAFFNFDPYTYNVTKLYGVPSFYIGCYPTDALFESTLECYYNQSCMDAITFYMPPNTTPVNFTALNGSQTQATETIGSIVNRMFVDDWSSQISFTSYYHACSPASCTYEYTRRRSLLSLVTIIIGIFGGLTTILKIIILVLLRITSKIRTEQSFCAHCRSMKKWFLTLNNEKYLADRLKIFLLMVILTGLFLASILTKQSESVQILKPSLSVYNDLLMKYPTTLQCPCSKVSVQYRSFVYISSVTYHQVCSSDFVTDPWFIALYGNGTTTQLVSDDYLYTLVNQLRFLASLCQMTQEVFNDALSTFNNSDFIEVYLVSPIIFAKQIQSVISQFQNNTPNSFLSTHELVRKMAAANTLINLFETNWQWIDMTNDLYDYATVHTRPVTYGTCDCGLSTQCFQAATMANNQSIPGLLTGCHPVEAFLQSTFECLYNSSCIRQLYTANISFTPLNTSLPSQYKKSSTLEDITNQLMVEQWSVNITYEKYFAECAPLFCTYSYLKHHPTIDALTTLLGLYGGLVIIMKILVPFLVNMWTAIKNSRHPVHPISG